MQSIQLSDKQRNHFAGQLQRENFSITPAGVYFPTDGVTMNGEYFSRVNGANWEKEGDNLVVKEGLIHILNVALGNLAKPAGYFLALFAGNTAPDNTWTAASFAAVSSEVVSQTEGYTGATRPAWTPVNASANASIDNFAGAAEMTMATSGSLTVTGAALLTSSQRGGTTGVLVSASKFAVPRTFQSGDLYELGYRLNATV